MKYSLLICLCFITGSIYAAAKEKLPIPRFVTLKSNKINARTGPNVNYPIKWVFTNKGEPVEVIEEFDQWRQIYDISGETGWVHESMLSSKRTAILIGKENKFIHKNTSEQSKKICEVEVGARLQLVECQEKYCKVQEPECKGWIQKQFLWGVYKDEKFKQ